MTLDEHIEELQALRKEHGNLPLISASDPEGNSYREVDNSPGVCHFDSEDACVYWNKEEADECEVEGFKINAVCVN